MLRFIPVQFSTEKGILLQRTVHLLIKVMHYNIHHCNFSDGELNDKFQGDIILTKQQEEELFGLSRTGLVNENYRWPNNTVFYEISPDFTQDRVDSIELGLRRIEEVTCIRFVKRTDEINYVYVTVSNQIDNSERNMTVLYI